jgi:hypothetical protein
MNMKKLATVAAVIGLFTGMASAAPLTGTYKSPDVGNDMLNGMWTERYDGGGEGQPGNTLVALSFDGYNLGAEWKLTSATLDSVGLLSDTGLTQTYQTFYTGGSLLLTDQGPWWNSDDDGGSTQYVVDVTSLVIQTTKIIVGGQEETYTSIVSLQGDFVDYTGYSVSFLQAAAVPMGSVPASNNGAEGSWGYIQKIRMQIIPEPATMSVLALGGLAVLLRKRNV